MYWPDTKTGVDVEPTRKPIASAARKYFSEGGVGQVPTVPGGDWFNQITNEILNVLAAAGINPSKVDDDQLLQAIKTILTGGFSLDGMLEAEPEWLDVPAYEDGGPGGQMNAQAQALANQTAFLQLKKISISTVSELPGRLLPVGSIVALTDRALGHFTIVAGGTPNGFNILNAGGGNTARYQIVCHADAKSFGVVGDKIADDTDALRTALNTVTHVTVPAGCTPLISETVIIPAGVKLEFLGGLGNTPTALPSSHIVKKSTMTGPGLVIEERGMMTGGGMFCQPGNTGDGIQLKGNSSRLLDACVFGAGRDGVRVGADGTYANSNAVYMYRVRSSDNGRYGIYVHDGVSVGPADANIGSLIDCIASRNGADGIRLGHCFWTTVQNCNGEGNTGYGLYLSGEANGSYPECRYPIIIGGDFNEGNNGTNNVNQVYDGAYFSTFIASDQLTMASNAGNALQGSGFRNSLAPRANALQGLTVMASAGGVDKSPLVAMNVQTGGQTFPMIIQQKSFGSNGNGPGIKARIDPNTGTYVDVGSLAWVQDGSNRYTAVLSAYNKNTDTMHSVALSANTVAFLPGADGALACGHVATRWSTFYGQTGSINTSDANEKTAPLTPESLAEYLGGHQDAILDAWGDVQIKAFQWLASIQQKGEEVARWHFGVIAQQVRDAFIAHGLDGCRFGLLCYDEWADEYAPVTEEYEEEVIEVDEKGRETTVIQTRTRETGEQRVVRAAGNRWGVRPDQCLFLESAYQRRERERDRAEFTAFRENVTARLAALEGKV